MESNQNIIDEINAEEVFREIKEPINDPNAVYVEFNPIPALEKLVTINEATNAEK